MGEVHSYRYVNTNSVPNSNSGTYTASSSSSALDMGATNTYRYVNTSALKKVSGTKSITANSNSVDVSSYQYAKVAVNRTLYVYMQKTGCRVCTSQSSSNYIFWSTSSAGEWEYKGSFSAM